jgi:putative MATE family efflux protein
VRSPPAAALPAVFAGRSLSWAVTRLAWPIIVENLFQSAVLLIDLLLVARLGAVAVAGVGTATQIMWLVMASASIVSIGATILIAQAFGRREVDDASLVTRQAIELALLLGLVGVALAPLSELIIAALGPEPAVVEIGADYLRVNLLSFGLLNLMMVISACLRGAGDSRTPMLVTGGATVVHTAAATLLIFGVGDWPGMGAVGSAWAAAIARGVGAALLLALLLRPTSRLPLIGRGGWRPDLGLMGRLLRLGLPAGLEQLILSFGFLVYSAMVIPLGTAAFATQRISFNLMSLSFMPGMGYSMAATTLTGQAIGARRPDLARRSSYIAVVQAGALMSLGGALFYFAGEWLMSFFSNDPEIIALGAAGLKVLALCQPFWALGQVMSGSLRGGGDTRYPMWVTMAGMWLLRLPIGYYAGIVLGYGLVGVYVSSIFDAVFRGLLNFHRFQRAPWLRPAEQAAPAAPAVVGDD